jgi:leucyl aminopeptidase (aminopeptidase T)
MMRNKKRESLHNMYSINLGIKKSEKVLIFSDRYNKQLKNIGKLTAEIGNSFTNQIKYIEFQPTGCHGTEPPENIWKAAFGDTIVQRLLQEHLLQPILVKKISDNQLQAIKKIIRLFRNEAVDVIIALSYFSTSHTRFRDLLNDICKTRYASMPLFDEEMLTGAMGVDWKRMSHRIGEIVSMVNKSETIEISTPKGTRITLSRKGRKVHADTGLITEPGSFSNLPAGEVYLAPLEGTTQGLLVIEWAPTRKLNNPIYLYVEKGMVVNVEGHEEYVDYLKGKFSETKENRNIAELGIGTNDKAMRPDNILEAEKILGTVHIALGDNSSFGGEVKTSFHQDFVFFEPTVTLIGNTGNRELLMKDGQMINNI